MDTQSTEVLVTVLLIRQAKRLSNIQKQYEQKPNNQSLQIFFYKMPSSTKKTIKKKMELKSGEKAHLTQKTMFLNQVYL